MLREAKNVMQVPGDLPRRWFCDEFFDLIVWFAPDGSVHGFQLCYDRGSHPRALTWLKDKGYRHDAIDDGEGVMGRHKASPVLTADGVFNSKSVADRLAVSAGALPAEILEIVLGKLREFKV